tara:strand:- start:4969 stop:5706 length:738 start_codon:yes stop_codon:yes gene_type:complete
MIKKVGLVPSRLNSSRLPEKALEIIEGMPMFAHVYFRAKESSLEDVYLLTDSQKIKKVAESYDIKTLITSSDHRNGTERCHEGAKILGLKDDDVIIDIQGDEPLINPEDISNILNFYLENKHEIVVSTLESDVYNNKNTVKVSLNQYGQIEYFSREDISTNTEKLVITKGLVAFCFKSLNRYAKTEETELERKVKHELQRCCENNISIFEFRIKHDSRAVDVKEDLDYVRQAIKNDSYLQNYIKS